MSFKVGQITSVSSITAGSVNIVGVGIVTYSNVYTASFTPGQYVCGNYTGGNLYVMADLDTAWINTLVQINANNQLPLATLQSSLTAAKYCAVKKGAKILVDEEKQCCEKDEALVMRTMNLIDSLRTCCIVPEGEIIDGRQAVYAFAVETLNLATHAVTVTIGTASYAFTTTSTNNTSTVASEIATYINSLYPQNYQYQAQSFGPNILVWGSDFDLSNGTAVSATITNGAFAAFLATQTLQEGTAKVLQGVNNITNTQIQLILGKLCQLCKN